jgi:DNA-binding MarR family transcriptional regulator
MAAGQSKAESFTAYLEAKQLGAKALAAPVAGGTALSILAVLAGNPGHSMQLMPDLQAASGMSFTSFAEAIKRLQDSGYITLNGPPGVESAQLTPLGADVASLAASA